MVSQLKAVLPLLAGTRLPKPWGFLSDSSAFVHHGAPVEWGRLLGRPLGEALGGRGWGWMGPCGQGGCPAGWWPVAGRGVGTLRPLAQRLFLVGKRVQRPPESCQLF